MDEPNDNELAKLLEVTLAAERSRDELNVPDDPPIERAEVTKILQDSLSAGLDLPDEVESNEIKADLPKKAAERVT